MVLTFNPVKFYLQWRETYLRTHPEKRLFPWLFEGSKTLIERERDPIISFTPEFKEKIEITKWTVALLAIGVLLMSYDS